MPKFRVYGTYTKEIEYKIDIVVDAEDEEQASEIAMEDSFAAIELTSYVGDEDLTIRELGAEEPPDQFMRRIGAPMLPLVMV